MQLTKALASAWAEDDVQVNAVLPGWIDTELTRETAQGNPGAEQPRAHAHARAALGRADDITPSAIFKQAAPATHHQRRHPG